MGGRNSPFLLNLQNKNKKLKQIMKIKTIKILIAFILFISALLAFTTVKAQNSKNVIVCNNAAYTLNKGVDWSDWIKGVYIFTFVYDNDLIQLQTKEKLINFSIITTVDVINASDHLIIKCLNLDNNDICYLRLSTYNKGEDFIYLEYPDSGLGGVYAISYVK